MPVYGWVAFAILGTGLILLLLFGESAALGIPAEQLAALTAMLALLVYLGGGMLSGRAPMGTLLRYAVIWGGLLCLVVGGYLVWSRMGLG